MNKELIRSSFNKSFILLIWLRFFAVLLTLLCLPLPGFSQKNVKLNNISIERGLSQNTVLSIIKDPEGFIWFGTQDGLNRFDGYSFITYRNNPKVKTSLSHNYVSTLFLDKAGNMWVGTWGGGLNFYDRRKGTFKVYKNNAQNPFSLSHDHVNYIAEDKNGVIWVATKNGLNKFDRKTGTFKVFKNELNNPTSLSFNDISAIIVDHTNTLWAATWGGGLNKYNAKTNTFTRFKHNRSNPTSISHNIIRSITEDQEGTLWVGTWDGLNRFDRASETFTNFRPGDATSASVRRNYISSILDDGNYLWIGSWGGGLFNFDKSALQFSRINNQNCDPKNLATISSCFKDNENNIWISTMGSGIYYFNTREEPFFTYQNVPGYPELGQGLSNDDINAMYTDKAGYIWIGTSEGLNRFDPNAKAFMVYKANGVDEGESLNYGKSGIINSNLITAIHQDSEGKLWVGTGDAGISVVDLQKEISQSFTYDKGSEGLSHNTIKVIAEDKKGLLWVGTSGGGVNVFDKSTNKFKVFKNHKKNPRSISDNYITCILIDRKGTVWIGTPHGLNRYHPATSDFDVFLSKEDVLGSLPTNEIFSLHEGSDGTIWIGTKLGLCKFMAGAGNFVTYTEKDGLPAHEIYSFLEDNKRNLWVSTNRGISKFNPSRKTFRNFDIRDGLQSSIFSFQASTKDLQGNFYFGGIAGFTVFNPDSIEGNRFVPPVEITAISGFNKTLLTEEQIKKDTLVEITSKDAFFTIEFASLSYVLPEKNRYRYKLDGFDNDWIYSGTKREATYTNLDGGSYTFMVLGSNNQGVWNTKPAILRIRIVPPWWKTVWFRSLLAVLAMALVYVGYKIQTEQITLKNRALEVKVQERTKQIELQKREIELNHDKLNKLNLEVIHKNEELERKVDERTKELQARELQLRLITDALPVLISYIDQDYTFRFNNKTYEEWFGLTSEQINNKTVSEVIGDAAFGKIKQYAELALKGEQVHYEEEMPYKMGNKHVSAFFVPNVEGDKVLGFYALITDITERKQIEEALAKALKESEGKNEELLRINTDLDNFVYTASHDLRSPITNLEGLLQLIIKNIQGKISPFEENILNMMNNSIIRLKRTINELGEIARVQKEFLPEEVLQFHEVIEEVKEDIASIIAQTNAEIVEELEVESINYPHKHLRSILYNLISNGIKYSSPNRTPKIVIKTKKIGDKIRLSVTDNGLGLEENQINKIFKMFKRLHIHVEGSGVGLYIVKRIIENNGGTISVESKVDKGTTFYVNF